MSVEKVPREEIVQLEIQQRSGEMVKQQALEAMLLASMEAAKIVYEIMTDPEEDTQSRLRAAEILFSRTIPKVAAKHVEEQGDVIDSADVASLRESIVAEIKRKTGQ